MFHIILNAIALAAVTCWWGALTFASLARLKGNNWETNTISHYLTGPDGKAVDYGFYALAIGLFALAILFGGWSSVFYIVGGIGTVGAAVTRAVWSRGTLHVISAGLAFVGIGLADIFASLNHPWMLGLAILAPVVALIDYGTKRNSAIEEKSVAICYVLWVMLATSSALAGRPFI